MALVNPKTVIRIEATDINFSRWKVFINEAEITRDVMGIMLELNRGCLPLVTLQCTALLDLPESFEARIEAPKRLYA